MNTCKLILTILFHVFLGKSISSQDDSTKVLRLYNAKTKKEIKVKEGSEIKILTDQDWTFMEEFTIKDDSTLLVDGKDYLINEITDIKYLEEFSGVPAGMFITGGTLAMIVGMTIAKNHAPQPGIIGLFESLGQAALGSLTVLVGAVCTTAGTLIFVRSRNHKKSKGWEYNIE